MLLHCTQKEYHMVTLRERIEPRLIRNEDGCLIWPGATTNTGYGRINRRTNPGTELVHRIMYELEHGPIPDGLVIDHLCRTTLCAEVTHLEAVTQYENCQRGVRAQQTHCIHGHEFTPENTIRAGAAGRRSCRECKNSRRRRG